jgi:hypothetical protein
MDIIHNILEIQSCSPAYACNFILAGQGLFGVSFLFVLRFIGKVLLIFAVSAIISKILKLDKAYDDLHHHKRA